MVISRVLRTIGEAAALVCGAGLIVYGIALVYVPAAFIVAGLAIIGAAEVLL